MKRFCSGDVVPDYSAGFQFSNEEATLQAPDLRPLPEYGLRDNPPALPEPVGSQTKSVSAA